MMTLGPTRPQLASIVRLRASRLFSDSYGEKTPTALQKKNRYFVKGRTGMKETYQI